MAWRIAQRAQREKIFNPMPSAFLNLKSESEAEMEKWKCKVCGYIYDPENGDSDGNVPPGTPFNKVPDDWVCPLCGAPKDMFEKA